MRTFHLTLFVLAAILSTVADASAFNPPACSGVNGLDQTFESGFTAGSGCAQSGWTGYCPNATSGFLIQNVSPISGTWSASFQTTGVPAGFTSAFASPTSSPQGGRLNFDMVMIPSAGNPGFSVETYPCTGCVVNTRLRFDASGSIDVLQSPTCIAGVFMPSTATWTAGTVMRIGIEVDGTGNLWVLKDETLVFSGTDLAVSCSTSRGIAGFLVAVDNTGVGDMLTVDNIGCPGNAMKTGASAGRVDIDDLLAVINQWGACPLPPAPCSANLINAVSSTASLNVVDIDDLVAVICGWGPCF